MACEQTSCTAICGDGLKIGNEACDNGDSTNAGVGCSDECTVECGFVCDANERQVCVSECGDGILASDEACDDANTISGDGCTSTCDDTESGWECDTTIACQETICGQCAAGKYELDGVCQDCPAGTHLSIEGSSSSLDCIECQAGQYSNSALTACNACPNNSNSFKTNTTLTACTCNSGWTGPDGGDCIACETGKYKIDQGNWPCNQCGSGKYSNQTSAISETACSQCSENSDPNIKSSACRCQIGFFGYDNTKCMACEEDTYQDAIGSVVCNECPANSVSPKGSTAKTACVCKFGFQGKIGGPCQPEVKDLPSDASLQDLLSATDVIVKMVVGLKISVDEFDNAKQLNFRQGIADAAAVALGKVWITNIQVQTPSGRRLLVDSIKIDVEVAAKDTNAAASVVKMLTVENINFQLSKAGLPEAEVLSVPVVSAASSPPAEPEGKSNNMAIIIVAVSAVTGAVLMGIAVFVYCRRRTLVDLEIEAGLPSRLMNDLGINTSDENQLPRRANDMCAYQEALTGRNSTLEAVENDPSNIGRHQQVNTQEVNLDSVVMYVRGESVFVT